MDLGKVDPSAKPKDFISRKARPVLMAIVARILILFSCLFGFLAPEIGWASAPVTVHLGHSHTHLLIVSARINGRGPYKFILDTGSNVSLIESSLFRQLDLKETGHPSSKVIDWMTLGKIAIADEIAVEDGPSLRNIRVLEVDGIKRSDIDPSVRGVLGENFLSGLDLLIDNRRHEITFDSSDTLASSLGGERLTLILTADVHGVKVKDHPLVSARLASLKEDRPLQLLLDTGSEGAFIAPQPGSNAEMVSTSTVSKPGAALLGQSPPCANWKSQLRLGKTITPKIKITSCTNSASTVPNNDGILPTHIFDRIFISHARRYFILNPVENR